MEAQEVGTPYIQQEERGQRGGVDILSSIPVAFPQRQL